MNYCPQCGAKLETRIIDGRERQVCPSPECGFVHWDNPVPVVAALVQQGDSIVLARNALWPRGIFSVVTGYLEKNETPEVGALREVAEELGVEGEVTAFLGHYMVFEKNQLILAFAVRVNSEIKIGEEIAEYKLVAGEELVAGGIDAAETIKLLRQHTNVDFAVLPLAVWCWSRCQSGRSIKNPA